MQNISQPLNITLNRRWFTTRPAKAAILILFGNLLPAYIYALGDMQFLMGSITTNSLIFCIAAALAGWLVQSRLSNYSKTSRFALILPATLTPFAISYFAILITRTQFSIAILLMSTVCTLVLSFLLAYLTRPLPLTPYVVPGGRVDEVLRYFAEEAVLLATPNPALISSNPRSESVVVADLHFTHDPNWEAFLANLALRDVPVLHYKQLWETYSGQVRIDRLSENSFGSLLPNRPYMRIKRAVDLTSSLILLPLLLPVFAIVAIMVKLSSEGPVFFLQERVGFRGKMFRMIKFRTMVNEHPHHDAPDGEITRSEDERITKVGRILRNYRIDELPQIINILKGDMSWIGPRPEAFQLSQWYGQCIPFYAYRHIVRPGITGWAQVNQGHVADLDSVNDKLRYDFYYIKYFSYWLDALVMLKTVRVVLGGIGAK